MRIETSTNISQEEVAKVEKILRDVSSKPGNENFFRANDRLEVANNPNAPSIDELSKKLNANSTIQADPAFCGIAYAAARAACNGNPVCEIAAAAAYQACLDLNI